MSNTEPLVIYKTPQLKRIQFVVIAFVVMVVATIISVVLIGRGILPLFGIIGIAIATYFTSIQTIRLYPDRVTQKGFIGKALECSYKDGAFSLEQASTFEALLVSFKPKKLIIRYKPKGSEKRLALGATISDADLQEIYQRIQEKQQTKQ